MGEERTEPRVDEHESGPSAATWRSVLTWNVPTVVTLSCAAIGMPLLDLYGNHPTVFVTADLTTAQIVTFGLLVVLVPAVVVAVVEVAAFALDRRSIRFVHTGLVALLAAVLGLVLLRKLAPDLGAWSLVAAALAGAAVAVAEQRLVVVRTLLRYAVVLPVVVLFMFLAVSPTSDLFGTEPDALALPADGDYPPVLFLVFDELPLVSLMGSDGQVRADLYPNFARLSASSNWYRNAIAQSSATELSLPSLLTGRVPDPDLVGSSVDWPENLFTLLGDEYDVEAHEAATHLCPASVCDTASHERGSLAPFFADASVVWGHLTLPSPWRGDLPAIDQTWGDFVDDGATTETREATDEGADADAHEQLLDEGIEPRLKELTSADARARPLVDLLETVDSSVPRRLHFAHALFPHFPWQTTPEGRVVVDPETLDLGRPASGPDQNRWVDDEVLTRFWLQRHLLQVGAADRMLGAAIDQFEEEGLWEEALVVVVSDHGASFEPGHYERGFEGSANIDDMYRVPLFIKLPGQTDGEVIDDPAQLLDVVPTVVDALAIDVDWDFDGRSLLSDPAPATRAVYHPDGHLVVSDSVDGLYRAIERKEGRFAGGTGWLSVASAGVLGSYVGRDAAELDLTYIASSAYTLEQAEALAHVELDASPVPVVVTGTVDLPEEPAAREFLLILNGTVAGVAHLEGRGSPSRFAGLVGEELLVDGANDLRLAVAPR